MQWLNILYKLNLYPIYITPHYKYCHLLTVDTINIFVNGIFNVNLKIHIIRRDITDYDMIAKFQTAIVNNYLRVLEHTPTV
jgi:hypothetical protein